MATLVIAEHEHGSLKGATRNTVTAALRCGGDVSTHPAIALHTFRRPPVISLPDSDGSLSTFSRMSARSAVVVIEGATDRMSAAAPATCGAAIEPPLR